MNEFVERIITLDNIKQWEERDSVIKESVSQHSFKVAAICVYLLENVFTESYPSDFEVFKNRCIQYAILHDFDESIIKRDISHVVKYNDFNGVDIRKTLENFVNFSLTEMNLNYLFDKVFNEEKLFVKLCDWIALYTFVLRNRAMGVTTFNEEEKYCVENINKKAFEVGVMLQKRFNPQHFYSMNIFETIVNKIIL